MVRNNHSNDQLERLGPTDIAPWNAPGASDPWQSGGEDGSHQSLWAMIDDRMRGRWKWAAMLGLILAAVLGLFGYDSAAPLYQSVGVIRIVLDTPPVKSEIYENSKRTPAEVATQIELIRADPVLQHALDDPKLASLPFAKGRRAVKIMKNGLDVKPRGDSELVMVTFEHEDPAVAQAVINAVLHSYYDLYGQYNGNRINTTLQELTEHAAAWEREQRSIRSTMTRIINKYNVGDLRDLQKANQDKMSALDQQTGTLQRALARMEGKSEVADEHSIAPPPADLEKLFPNLVMLRQKYEDAQNEFEQAKISHMPGSTRYVIAEDKAQSALILYQDGYKTAVAQWQRAGGETAAALRNGALDGARTPDQVRALLKERQAEAAKLSAENQQLTMDIQEVADLKEQDERLKQDLKDTQSRIEALKIESPSLTKQITIEQEGYLPEEPSSDARSKRGIAGMAVGLLGSFGLFFLWGTLDRRAYGARQLQLGAGANVPPCLGVLPDLGHRPRDQETTDVAAHCVHQIRNQIEARRGARPGYALAISSPFQGDGKTSIVMALGWSYAAAGFKTLVIDCDMVGRSLTRQLGLVGHEGLKEALLSRQLNGAVVRTSIEHLSAVPVGSDPRFGPESLKRRDLDQLLAEVRDRFDIILIDTGPMLGSLESTPVTAASDGVVLSVRRGRSRTRLEECASRLDMVGARCVGVILNYAVRADCNRYVSEASLAAAEDGRGVSAASPKRTVLRTVNGERNALMQVMETSRLRAEPAAESST